MLARGPFPTVGDTCLVPQELPERTSRLMPDDSAGHESNLQSEEIGRSEGELEVRSRQRVLTEAAELLEGRAAVHDIAGRRQLNVRWLFGGQECGVAGRVLSDGATGRFVTAQDRTRGAGI